MKQKIVINVHMRCGKCRKEAMKIAASTDGVISVTLQGNDKDQLVVIGNEVDAVGLCTTLRKKAGNAIIQSVEEVKPPQPVQKVVPSPCPGIEVKIQVDNKQEKSGDQPERKEKKPAPPPCPCPGMYYQPPCPPPQYCQNPQVFMCAIPPDDNQQCNIM